MSDQPVTKLGPWKARPMPALSPEIIPFWEGIRRHEFRLCRCKRCGQDYFPYTMCTRHPDIPDFSEMEWAPASGRGHVFAHVTVNVAIDPDYADEIPYVLAVIELQEGPLFPGRLVDCAPGDISVGTPVGVRYEDVPETGQTWPLFVPQG